MTALTSTRNFDGVILHGLFARAGVMAELVGMWADPEVRELLAVIVAANATLEGDADPGEKRLAQIAADGAQAALARILASWNARLSLDDAIGLREALITSRLGQGRADTWNSNPEVGVTALDERPLVGEAELIGVFEPGSPEWHAARENGIGGSEIAAVLGISTWESAFSLWHRKRGLVPPRETSTEMDAGRRLEPVICDVFAERHPELEMRRGGTFRHRERAYQLANPDELVYVDGELAAIHEAKYALFPDNWGEEGTDEVPVYYQAQCRWYLDTFGVAICYLTVFIGSTGEFREYVVGVDAEDTATLRKAGEVFMDAVERNVRPRIDGHEATFRTVKELPDGQFDMDVEIYPILRDQYFDALQALDAAKAEKNRASSLVLDLIDTGRRAMCRGERVATRTVRDGKTYSLQPARNRGISA